MKEYKIIDVRTRECSNSDYGIRFVGFELEDELGDADPFVGSNFDYKNSKDIDITYLKGGMIDKQLYPNHTSLLSWAHYQVGKVLVCEELAFKVFATHGVTSIREQTNE